MALKQREGVLLERPDCRLSADQVKLLDGVSRDLLEDPGMLCYNAAATDLFREAGAKVEAADGCARLRVPSAVVDRVLDTVGKWRMRHERTGSEGHGRRS